MVIALLADTGLRVGKLVALSWGHVDLTADPPELFLSVIDRKICSRKHTVCSYLSLRPEHIRTVVPERHLRVKYWHAQGTPPPPFGGADPPTFTPGVSNRENP